MKRADLIRLAVSSGCVAPSAAPVAAALSFNAGLSTINYKHDVVDGGTVDRTVSQPTPAIQTPSTVSFILPDLTLTGAPDGIATLKSRAKVGFAKNETTTVGTGLFKSGSLLTQSDPGNAAGEVFSTLTVDYNLVWNVTAPGFGPPIIGSFSVPLLAVVGTGGAASAEIIDMNWERFDGSTTTTLRSPGNATVNFGVGTTLTTLSVPGAAFVPSGLTTGDRFIVRGSVKLSVKNATDPVSITIDPDYQETVLDDGATVQYRFDDAPIGGTPLQAIDTALPMGANNGIYTGNVALAPGLRNAALHLDGVDNAVQGNFVSSQSFTTELWASSATPNWNANGWLVNAGGPNGFQISPVLNSTQLEAIVFDASGNPFSLGLFDVGAADITHLHHYALTFDQASGNARLFFDGVPVLNAGFAGLLRDAGVPRSMVLGFGGGQFGAGVIDEFAYYDLALRPEVLASHFVLGVTNPENAPRLIGAEILADTPEPGTVALLAMAGAAGLRRRMYSSRSAR